MLKIKHYDWKLQITCFKQSEFIISAWRSYYMLKLVCDIGSCIGNLELGKPLWPCRGILLALNEIWLKLCWCRSLNYSKRPGAKFGQWLCGLVDRAVASNTRGPWFESSHRQKFIYIEHLFTVNCVLKRQK